MIYEAMIDLYTRHEPIDLLSLSSRLDDKNNWKQSADART